MRKTVAGLSVAVLLSMTLHAQEKPVFTPIQPPVLPHALGGSDAVPVPMEDNTPPNYTSFPQKPKPDLQAWKKYNPKNEYDHPEFGTLPDDAPCANCVELLDKRKATQRYYEDLADPTKIYIQKSLDNINMQEQGRWISTSPKLHAEAPGTYASGHGLEPVSIDLNRKEVILHTVYGEVTFNNWSLWAKRNGQLVQLGTADWSHYTIGEDGMVVTNIFKGIDAELRVLRGAVKTSFTIKSNAYGAFSELIFRDDFNEGNGTSIRFSGDPTSKKGTGSLLVSLDGKDAIKVGEAVARLKDVARDGLFVLPYELDGKGMNIVVPGAWINANIKNHQLIIDPLVTGTNSLAASAITGSAQSTAASCGFDNYCSYSLTVTQPAATTITDVNIAGGIFATAPCFVSDGGFAFLMGSCVSPAPGEVWWCGSNTSGGCAFGGNSMFSSFSSCLPAPSCATQDLTFKMILCRTCKGVAGCDGSCIGTAGPFTVTLICHTVEFAIPAGGSAITITGDTCQGQGPLNAKVTAYGGVPPYSITWSTNASGTPVYATGATTTFNYPTAGSYPVYAFITDACNNSFQTTKTITIDPPKFATANITICANQLPYSWNGQSLTAGGMAVATYITPSLVTGCDSTTTLNLTVNTLPAITTQPTNATILINSNATFSTAATGTGPLTYQWQVNTGGGYTTIADGGVYSNSATPNLTITNAPLGMNG